MNPALRELTTLRVGGVPRAYISVRSLEDVERVRSVALEQGLSVAMLGGGSNVLAREGELNIALAHMQITGIDFFDHGDMCSVAVGAGVSWDLFVEATVRRGLWGIENLSGIPGTVGAAPIQNIGAYGVEIKDALTSLLAMDMETGKVQEFEKNACKFSYRNSYFKTKDGRKYLIFKVNFSFSKRSSPQLGYKDLQSYFAGVASPSLHDIRRAVLAIRNDKFPHLDQVGSAGSFFKNVVLSENEFKKLSAMFPGLPGHETSSGLIKIPLAHILESLGLKGKRVGMVGLSEYHALVLLTYGTVMYEDIDAFAKEIEQCVLKKTGIQIEREVISFPLK